MVEGHWLEGELTAGAVEFLPQEGAPQYIALRVRAQVRHDNNVL